MAPRRACIRSRAGSSSSLDAAHRRATLVDQFVHPTPLLADSQGDLQALPNGDWFMGWGQVPDFSELSPSGQLLFDAHFPPHTQSYRSLRFAWTGTPAHRPTFAIRPGPNGGGAVYASWNGALVTGWRVLAGSARTRSRPSPKRRARALRPKSSSRVPCSARLTRSRRSAAPAP